MPNAFLEDAIVESVGGRAVQHVSRHAGKYAVGAAGTIAAGFGAKQAGRAAGRTSVKRNDPHYDMNYRQGKAIFHARDRDIRRKQQEGLDEGVERVIPVAAGAAGAGYLASRAYSGVKKGRFEKRQSATNRGYVDAYQSRYGNRRRESEFEEDDHICEGPSCSHPIHESILQERIGLGSVLRRLRPGRKAAIAGGIGAVGAGAAGYGGYRATKKVVKTVTESDFDEDLAEGVGRGAGEALKWTGRSLAALDIGVLGAQGIKGIKNRGKNKQNEEENPFLEDELAERFKGSGAKTAAELALKHSGKADTALFGLGTANSGYNKSRDLADDQKLNSSHLRRVRR